MRVAMRALFGLDPDGERARAIDAAGLFEEALAFYSSEYLLRIFRGRRSPWGRMQQAARQLDALIYSEIAERRASGRRGEDILSLLLDAEDEDGNRLTDVQIRDEVMTLLFAGHDTTTSTVSFMFYELARQSGCRRPAGGRAGRDARGRSAGRRTAPLRGAGRARDGARRDAAQVPARLGRPAARDRAVRVRRPHRARPGVRQLLLLGQPPPARRVREPEAFRPERFAPEAKAALPKGAYVPFGGGSRTCIGMRFGQLEVRTIATLILSRFTLSLPDDFQLKIRQMPTISPRDGLPMTVAHRAAAPAVL